MWSGTVGRIMGLVAAVVGMAGWVWALSVVLAQPSVHPVTVLFLLVMLLAIGGVGMGAYRYNARNRRGRLGLLIVATLLLAFGTILSGFSVGLAFLPATLLALAATLFISVGRERRP